MKGTSQKFAVVAASLAIALAACGGGGVSTVPAPAEFDLQAGITNMVAHGFTANVSLSGTAIVNGTSTPFTGSGTYTRAPAVNGTFNGAAALSQTVTISGTISAAGQSAPYSTSVIEYYATGNSAFLGEDAGVEYDVAQTPFDFPAMVVGGSTGILGTVSRYTDKNMGVSIGTAQVSYSVNTPIDPGSPILITLTNKIYDTQNTLTETDMTSYTMTSGNVISFASASAQGESGTLTITAQ